MKMKLSEAYLQCQDKSGRLGGVAGSVVLYVTPNNRADYCDQTEEVYYPDICINTCYYRYRR
jgi:hypothetical protein